MDLAIKRSRVFHCPTHQLFTMLEDDFKSTNGITATLTEGLVVENKKTKTTLVSYNKDQNMKVHMDSAKDSYEQVYLFKDVDGECEMTYEEYYDSFSMLRVLNFKLMRIIRNKRFGKRVEAMFQAVEQRLDEANQ